MKNIQFSATALLLTIALFCTNTLSAQWSQNSASIWNTNLNSNVGIGTSTPTNAKLQFANTVGNKITFYDHGNNVAYGFGLNAGNLCAYMPLGSKFSIRDNNYNGTEKFVVTSDGKVGIGTANPTSNFQVNVPASSSPIGAMSIDVGSFGNAANAAASYYFRVRDIGAAGYTPFYIRGDGNVGIGTTTPTAKFEVNLLNTNGWNGNKKAARFVAPDNNFYLDLNTYIVANGNVGYQFSPNGNTGLCISTPGNVGIGTTTPTNAKLQFANEVGNKITMYDHGNNVAYGFGINGGNLCAYMPLGSKFSIRDNNYNGAEKFVVTSDGNVGIGTSTPTNKLQVHGGDGLSLGFGPSPTGEGIGSKRTAGGNQWGLDFYTNSAARMSLTNAGNVGIGTTAPAYKLHVLGDIRCYNLYTNSDRRYKTNIQTLGGAMGKIMAMRGTTYDFAANRLPEGYKAGKQVGLIAQEMEAVMPELVSEDAEGMKSINYIGVIPVLVEALKEQHEVIAEKETRIAALEAQNTELQGRLARIEAALGIAADRQTDVKTEPVSAKASPNPTSGLVNIDLQNTATAKSVVVNIVDATGRQVAARNAAGASSLQFDLSQLPAGVYVAQIVADGKMVSSNKVQLVK